MNFSFFNNSFSPLARDIVNAIGAPCLFAPSVKIRSDTISYDRWLLTLPDIDLTNHVAKNIFLNFIDENAASLELLLSDKVSPACIHLGFDREGDVEIRKLYVEFENHPDNFEFLALKKKLGRFEIHTYESVRAEDCLLSLNLPYDLHRSVYRLISLFDDNFIALEVTNSSRSRKSLDLNLIGLSPIAEINVHIEDILSIVNPNASDILKSYPVAPSHLAVGSISNDKVFATIYDHPVWIEPGGNFA